VAKIGTVSAFMVRRSVVRDARAIYISLQSMRLYEVMKRKKKEIKENPYDQESKDK
jgi:hypothetical protein